MKILSRKIDQDVQIKNWTPIKVSNKGPKMLHMFFANDIVLMSRPNASNCECIQKTMKSSHNILNKLNILSGKNFGKYMGVPISHESVSKNNYHFIINNMQTKLSGWKTTFLNIARRTTLAKSCLNNIPTYIMHIIKLPKRMTNKIDQIPHNFI